MTEKHNWITDDLCLIEESTGVKLYGTVCTDIRFIANQLNDNNITIRRLEKKNNELTEEKETYKMLWEQMSYYFEDRKELKDLDYKDFRALQRLAKGLVD